jgi:predicted transcriptional regulator
MVFQGRQPGSVRAALLPFVPSTSQLLARGSSVVDGLFRLAYARPMERREHLDITGKLARLGSDSVNGVAVEVFKALGNDSRWRILSYLSERFVPVNQIAQDLGLPASTASRHIALLEDVGLVHTGMRPATRGLEKVVARRYEAILVDLPRRDGDDDHVIEVSMPIGAYMDFQVEPTCGLAGADGLIGLQDDQSSFYDPDRVAAQLLWFGAGYVEYQFPNRTPAGSAVASVGLSCEICSEAPLYDLDWPSDVSVWINGVHLGEWTCPGDFGDRRGRLTPAWWPSTNTQYGLQKRWQVSAGGTSLDGVRLSEVALDALDLQPDRPIRVRIGVRPEARHVGGLNLFGRAFGNYPQDLVLSLEYEPPASVSTL